jgi:hypothetical protein
MSEAVRPGSPQLQRLGPMTLGDEKVSNKMVAFRVSLPLSSGSRAR